LKLERAQWIDWRAGALPRIEGARVYAGHETCERLLPSLDAAAALLGELGERQLEMTLVTPLLTETGLHAAQALIDGLLRVRPALEIVCSDWGLLAWLTGLGAGIAVAGRMLSGQSVDPRLARLLHQAGCADERTVRLVDGRSCRVRKRPPSAALTAHLRSLALDRTENLDLLAELGVHRCELSSVPQGIETRSGWSYTLHVPWIPLGVLAACPDAAPDGDCDPAACGDRVERWEAEDFCCPIYRRANGLHCLSSVVPEELERLGIDRIVTAEGAC
jgi:hypothetical protein